MAELIVIDGGRVAFLDRVEAERREWLITDIQIKLRDVPLGDYGMTTKFRFSASLAEAQLPFLGDEASGEGSINLHERDMDATVEVLDPAGTVAFSTRLRSENNDMFVSGMVKLRGLKSSAKGGEDSLEHVLLGALKASGMEVGADFSFKTRMDHFEARDVKFSGNFTSAGSLTTERSGNIINDLKGIGKQFEAIGKKMATPEKPQTEQP